jgi:xylan 1,4-beta-xylosidase
MMYFRICILVVAALAAWVAPLHAQVTATVRWETPTGKSAGSWHYGLNLFQGFNPAVAGNPGNSNYRQNLAAMKPGMIRYHRRDMIQDSTSNANGWATGLGAGQTTGWDATKINNAMSNLNSWGGTIKMNIPGWPDKWKLANGRLDPARYTDFANWCAQLVQIINVQQGRNVLYWEVPNERDDAYSGFDGHAELGRIFNQCRTAMRNVDSRIKVGGPAFANPYNQNNVDGFLSTAAANVDFVSYHTYSSGSTADTNQNLFNSANGVGWATTFIKGRIAAYTSRTVETFHNEYNISWNPPDTRMNNEIGMVFDALAMLSIVKAGATGAMAWNESDGWYGKLANEWGNYGRRSASYLYEIFNTDMGGNEVETSVSDTNKVQIMGVKGGTWHKLALVNRAESNQTVTFTTFSGLPSGVTSSTSFTVKRIESWGISYSSVTLGTLQSGYTLPSNTVTVLILDTSSITPPSSGTLTVSYAAASGSVNLATQGTQDWIHFGLPTSISLTNHGVNRKSGANQISDFSIIGADNIYRLTDFPTQMSWTGGTPTASATNTRTGVALYKWWAVNTGFRITVPAGTTQRTLKLYCGTWNANGQIRASLSDGSAATVTHRRRLQSPNRLLHDCL